MGFGPIMPLQLEDELLQAISENQVAAVAALLAAGADPNAGLFRDVTALSIAVRNGSEEILDLLLQRGPFYCMKEEYGKAQKHPLTT
jgi:ankyrin repeat protein